MKIYYKCTRRRREGTYLEHDTKEGVLFYVYAKTKVRMRPAGFKPYVDINEWLIRRGYKRIFPKYLQVDEGL